MAEIGAQPGNRNAAKGKVWEGAIRRAIAKRMAGNFDGALDALAERLVMAAESGDQWALLEIGNRLDGKPAQAVLLSGDDENPVNLSHTVKFIG